MKTKTGWRLNLASRGLLMLALPLALQLALVATLCYIHDRAEVYSIRAGNARNFFSAYANYVARSNATIGRLNEAVSARQPLGEKGKMDEVLLVTDSMDLERNMRIQMSIPAPHALYVPPAAIDKLHSITESIGKMAPVVDRLASTDPAAQEYKPLRDQFDHLNAAATGELVALGETGVQRIRKAPEFWAEDRTRWATIVMAGIIINIGAVLLLLVFFNRSIVSRLLVILDNSFRLAAERELHPPVPGGDEIAELDGAFHNMADALNEAIQKQRLLIENARDVICSIDDQGVFLAMSNAAISVFGYSHEELIGCNVLNVVPDEDGASLLKHLGDLRGGKDAPEFETRFIRKDARQIDILWSAYWSEPAGAAICVAHDITERKGAERLRQEVMQMVSHDLRSPLSTIQAFHSMLAEGMFGKIDEKGQRFLNSADFSSRRMLALINDLLEIEKMEAGALELERRWLPVSELFDEAIKSVTPTAETKGVRLRGASTEVMVFGDSDRLLQVLINLLSNAIKFTPPEALVSLSAVQTEHATEIRVTDQGRGIPEHLQKTIFDRFKQARSSDAQGKSGFGLGLAICKALVALHGGDLSVQSTEGVGSVFSFRIPAEPVSAGITLAVPTNVTTER
jgi:PAS domain S-box-containing protein